MKIFNVALIFAIMGGLIYLAVPALHEFDFVNALALLSGEIQVNSVANEPLVVFVAPKGHFKVSFPGNPREINENNGWLHRTMLLPPSYFVADRESSFYASEKTINDWETPGKYPYTPITNVGAKIDLSRANRSLSNNEAAARAMANSPVIQVQNFLDYKCSEVASNAGGKVDTIAPCDTGGGMFLGQSAEGTIVSSKAKFRLRMFYDAGGKRLFAVVVIGTPERVKSAQATKFLDSLAIWQ